MPKEVSYELGKQIIRDLIRSLEESLKFRLVEDTENLQTDMLFFTEVAKDSFKRGVNIFKQRDKLEEVK